MRDPWMNGFQLRVRLPEEWAEKVKTLVERLRAAAARIIWWDYFSNRMVSDRWDHLDEYLNAPGEPISPKELSEALQQCGYSKKKANSRAGYIEPKNDKGGA